MKNPTRYSVLFVILLAALWTITGGLVLQARAAPDGQIPIYTPTPGPDGRIIYIVQANDTLLSISLITGVPVEKLQALNNLTNDMIFPGQELLLGFAGPAEVTFTPGPTPTPTPLLPTPSPKPGKATLCLRLFDDLNGDSIRQESELSLAGGRISFGNRVGTVSENAPTIAGEDPQCFNELPEGDYSISVAVPEGYNPTTATSYDLALKAGDEGYINFGAQANTQTLAEAPAVPAPAGNRSPILGIAGAIFLIAGIGVAIFAGRMLRSK